MVESAQLGSFWCVWFHHTVNAPDTRASTAAGWPVARSRSGSFGFVTASSWHAATRTAVNVRGMNCIMRVIGRSPPGGSELQEHRGRDRSEPRVVEIVDARNRVIRVCLLVAHLGIVPAVVGHGEQVTPNQGERRTANARRTKQAEDLRRHAIADGDLA